MTAKSILFFCLIVSAMAVHAAGNNKPFIGYIKLIDRNSGNQHMEGITELEAKRYTVEVYDNRSKPVWLFLEDIKQLDMADVAQRYPFYNTVDHKGNKYYSKVNFFEKKGSSSTMLGGARYPLRYEAYNLMNNQYEPRELDAPADSIVSLYLGTDELSKKHIESTLADELIAINQRKVELLQQVVAQEEQKEKSHKALAKATARFRESLVIGNDTHCGLVVEVKKPIAKVQTLVGERWFKIAQLYPKDTHHCQFVNGQYVEN